ncbi:MAG: helix-turn-helix domain-containing protein [Bacteroidales bacterium]|nr:helix-turn-helix domain-containing protein [Bacteroidales bacterium]
MPEVRPDAILRLLAAKGWSKERLAKKAGVNPRTISNILSGKPFRADTLGCIAEALRVPAAALLVGYEDDPLAVAGREDASVRISIDIPLKVFKQEEVLKPWMEAFKMLATLQSNITINDIREGSVKLDLSMSDTDAARLVRAFAAGKLDQAKITQVAVPRQLIFTLLSGLMTIGAANPLFIPLLPFVGYFLLKQRLSQAGISTTFQDGNVVLTRIEETTTPPQAASAKSSDAAEIRTAIELTTPDYLLPALPCTITLLLEPAEGNQPSSTDLGEQLENLLKTRPTLAAGVSRTETSVPWGGSLQLHLPAAEALREMSEVILTHFLDTPTKLTIGYSKEFRSDAGELALKSRMRMSLSSDVWESVAQEIAGLLAEPNTPESGPDE